MSRKLNNVVALERALKSRSYSELTELHKKAQKNELYNGFSKKFRKKDEAGEDFPPEAKNVSVVGEQVLRDVIHLVSDFYDITLEKDCANQTAQADLTVDGKVLLSGVPVTTLLFLEKQLTDIRTFIEKIPVLDAAEEWTLDENSGVYKTAPTTTHRNKKVNIPLVLYPATEKHPAQTQVVQDDVVTGWWETVKVSGALPTPRKTALLARINNLLDSVVSAREKANDIEVGKVASLSTAVFTYLLG